MHLCACDVHLCCRSTYIIHMNDLKILINRPLTFSIVFRLNEIRQRTSKRRLLFLLQKKNKIKKFLSIIPFTSIEKSLPNEGAGLRLHFIASCLV